jgi:signal transduction histidine kinase/CheY-like chemotaxis protein
VAALSWRRRVVDFARITSTLVAVAALTSLAGWLADSEGLRTLFAPGPNIKTNTAICLACIGLATLLIASGRTWQRWVGTVLALVAATAGGLTLSQHLGGWDLGIDQLVAREAPGAIATTSPNRMGPPASAALLLLGVALVLLDRRSRRLQVAGQALALLTSAIVLLPVMGYAYGFEELYSLSLYTGIAMLTSIFLLLLSVAVQSARPDVGLASLVSRDDEVGVFTRRVLSASTLLPFGSGWILSRLYGAGYIDVPVAITTMAIVVIVMQATIVWRSGSRLAQITDARAETAWALSVSEQSLREADQQKTEFLATLSHELRNPLAPIRFALDLLHAPPPVADRARQTIGRQVQHLTRLIDDLLDLTRITRNRLELHPRPSELRPLVGDAVDAVAGEVTRARHELVVDLPSAPVWLQVDPDRVVQLLVNLLTNASRHSDAGGRITVGALVETSTVTIVVRDAGHGIDPADLERVFERFVQVDGSRPGGLGIGLAIVKALAELHGGAVEARSAGRGQGTEMRVRLPRTEAPALRTAIGDLPAVSPRRILVVDDNRDAADMLCDVLTAQGHRVAVAYDAYQALRIVAEVPPEVGLVDIGMAGMDGYELTRRLRADASLRDLFLVAITGWGQHADRRRALDAGFDAHLTKPADPATLAALLASRFTAAVVPSS